MRIGAELAHALAAEYVVGTLRGRARQRFEAIARRDPQVAEVLRRWEAGLTPLVARVPDVRPPARVWRAIEARIAPAAPARNGGLWKALAFTASGLAAVLLAAFLWLLPGAREEPLFVAVLSTPKAEPRMVVSMHAPGELRVRVVKRWENVAGKDLELWVLPAEGAPRSLGVVRNEAVETILHLAPGDPRVAGAQALAVSLEPAGGSPTKQPTGPVLCSGPIAAVRKA